MSIEQPRYNLTLECKDTPCGNSDMTNKEFVDNNGSRLIEVNAEALRESVMGMNNIIVVIQDIHQPCCKDCLLDWCYSTSLMPDFTVYAQPWPWACSTFMSEILKILLLQPEILETYEIEKCELNDLILSSSEEIRPVWSHIPFTTCVRMLEVRPRHPEGFIEDLLAFLNVFMQFSDKIVCQLLLERSFNLTSCG